MRHAPLALALSLTSLVALTPAAAQQHPNVAQGFNPSASFAVGDVDNVNLFNGNLVIRIPLGQSYPVGPGFSYGLTLVYNSQVWEHQIYGATQSIPYRTNNAGLGWTVTLGQLDPPAYVGDMETARPTYMSPDGARHTFYPTLHEGDPVTPNVLYARDGTGQHLLHLLPHRPVLEDHRSAQPRALGLFQEHRFALSTGGGGSGGGGWLRHVGDAHDLSLQL